MRGTSTTYKAVAAARRAFEKGEWRDAAPAVKKRVLLRFAQLIRDSGDEACAAGDARCRQGDRQFARRVDVPFCADCIQYCAELADKLVDEIAPTGANDVALIRREPLGVVGAIVPWNYPLIITAWKIGPGFGRGQFGRPKAG